MGTEDYYRLQAESHYESALKKYDKRIDNFREHLKLYPSLALAHSLGRKIFKEITAKKVGSMKIGVRTWYRARRVDQPKVFNSDDLYAPPWGKSSGGRFHHSGQSVLNLAESKQLAMTETLDDPTIPSLIWVQEYKNVNQIDNILDLRYDWENFGQLSNLTIAALLASGCIFERVDDRSNKWKPQ
ncbi:RES family NAD+ phosphorylase [Paenibacillus amylolyticus]|nr:RES family NAD+ phosphorylase [Paenibacillus amylolyticus]